MGGKKNRGLVPLWQPPGVFIFRLCNGLERQRGGVAINSEVRLEGKTGAEMEALMAVSIAALTVYDMCKAVDKAMVIDDIRLLEKTGGKSDSSIHSDTIPR